MSIIKYDGYLKTPHLTMILSLLKGLPAISSLRERERKSTDFMTVAAAAASQSGLTT